MHSDELLDHFRNPRNVGELAPPAITVESTNPACGDILRLSMLLENGIIHDIRFKASGCVASIACGSALTELIKDRTLTDAMRITSSQIDACVGTLPQASRHAATLAQDALKLLLKSASDAAGK